MLDEPVIHTFRRRRFVSKANPFKQMNCKHVCVQCAINPKLAKNTLHLHVCGKCGISYLREQKCQPTRTNR